MKKLVLIILLVSFNVFSDIGILLLEAVGNVKHIARTGHISIHLPNICAQIVNKKYEFRVCENDPQGGIALSRYNKISDVEGEEYDYLAVPFLNHVYGVDKLSDMPLLANKELYDSLVRENYKKYVTDIVSTENDKIIRSDAANYFAKIFKRDVYGVYLKTSRKADQNIVNYLNSLENNGKFNFFTSNCADFGLDIVQSILPNFNLSYFDEPLITSPKGLAHSFLKISRKIQNNPLSFPEICQTAGDCNVTLARYVQLAGTFKKSVTPLYMFENIFRNWRCAVLFWPIMPVAVPIGFATYFCLFDNFSIQRAYKKELKNDIEDLNLKIQELSNVNSQATTVNMTTRNPIDDAMTLSPNADITSLVDELESKKSQLSLFDEKFKQRKKDFALLMQKLSEKNVLYMEESQRDVNSSKELLKASKNDIISYLSLRKDVIFDVDSNLKTSVSFSNVAKFSPSLEGIKQISENGNMEEKRFALHLLLGAYQDYLNRKKKNRPEILEFNTSFELITKISSEFLSEQKLN